MLMQDTVGVLKICEHGSKVIYMCSDLCETGYSDASFNIFLQHGVGGPL